MDNPEYLLRFVETFVSEKEPETSTETDFQVFDQESSMQRPESILNFDPSQPL
jgi:hypothetical protein